MPIRPDSPADFPSAEELAEMESDFVPAAGFALFPEGKPRTPVTIIAVAGAALVAAGVGVYRGLRAMTKAG